MLKFRTVLIIIGIFALLRFIGQFMKTRRANQEAEQRRRREKEVQKRRDFIRKNEGKAFIIPKDNSPHQSDIEDVDFEDVK